MLPTIRTAENFGTIIIICISLEKKKKELGEMCIVGGFFFAAAGKFAAVSTENNLIYAYFSPREPVSIYHV